MIVTLLVLALTMTSETDAAPVQGYVRACYISHNTPAERVPAHLCTHLLAVFGRVTDTGSISVSEEDKQRLTALTRLRGVNPALKVLLTVMGASDHFAAAAASDSARAQFAEAASTLVTSLQLDGLDVNWEFPGFPPWQRSSSERRHQTLLLQQLSAMLHNMTPRRLLMVAVGGPPTVVSVAYEVPEVAAAADYVSIMAYDLHFHQSITPFTGYNAPLHASWWEAGYFAKLNTASVVRNWLSKGLPARKMLVGIPTYGRGWKLLCGCWNRLGAPSVGQWGSGFPSYVTACNIIKNGGTRRWDDRAKVPYVFKGRQWVSYEDRRSVAVKAEFVKSVGAAGAMVFVLDSDDWAGECGEGEFPLTNVVKEILP